MMKEHRKLIAFKKRGLLSQKEFNDFLEYARRIAVFDPTYKRWVIDERKLNMLSKEELEYILETLRRYTTLTTTEIQEILSLRFSEEKCRSVGVDERLVVRRCSRELESLLEKEPSLNSMLERRGRYLVVKSIIYLEPLKKLLGEKYGINLLYDKRLTTVTINRLNGRLYVSFYRVDKPLYEVLSRVGTLTYNEERVVLGPNKEYMGTNLVRRKLRVYNLDWRKGVYETSVALFHRVKRALEATGLNVVVDIEELGDITYTFRPSFKLYPHQEEALRIWLREKRGTIAIFTRGGKSFIALAAINELKKPTIILVPTRELVLTWSRYLEEYLGIPRGLVGRMGGGEKSIKEITVSTYSSAVKYIKELTGKFEFAIFDEAHHVPAATFKEVALGLDSLYRMALSATPKRRDGNEELLYALCGDLIYNLSYADLLALKVVAPIEVFDTIFVEGWEEKLSALINILRKHEGSKTLIFTQRLDTARRIYEKLVRSGFKVEMITGETPSVKREIAFKKFLEGRVNILVTTTVLDEGITVPDAEVAVIFEGSGEARQMIQRVGRVLGYHPGKTAKVYEIVDITNPREKSAYRRRSWVKELYLVKNLEKYVQYVKEGREDDIKTSFQRRIDSF